MAKEYVKSDMNDRESQYENDFLLQELDGLHNPTAASPVQFRIAGDKGPAGNPTAAPMDGTNISAVDIGLDAMAKSRTRNVVDISGYTPAATVFSVQEVLDILTNETGPNGSIKLETSDIKFDASLGDTIIEVSIINDIDT
jgi:hypothetical protein